MKRYSFKNKNVLITGASGGLGSAIARNLAAAGARLLVTSRSAAALEELIASLPGGGFAKAVAADLAAPGEAQALAEKTLEAMGRIDAVFNNAGVGYFALMEEATEASIRHLFEVNTFAPLIIAKALLPSMLKHGGGRIINVVTCAGRVPIASAGVYGGSKSALALMTNTMRLELEPKGIDVLNVYPGTANTAFEENALREKERPGLCPKDRCGEPRFAIAKRILDAAGGPPGEIWLDRPGKWLSVAGLIWPRYVEKRLGKFRDRAVQRQSPSGRRWRLLQVESSLACNLRCLMCPWKEISKKAPDRGVMSPDVWGAIRPYLKEVASIDFTGGGEPLLQPHLAEWIGEAKSAGCETGFLSNGLLLTAKRLRAILDAGVDWICISMDGASAETYNRIRVGSNFERVCENVANIAALRSGRIPKTMINFVLMEMNFEEIDDIVRLAANLGVDQVNFKQCDVIRGQDGKGFGLFADSDNRRIRKFKKALTRTRRLAKKLGVATTAFSFTPNELPVCEQDPRDSMFVRHDGIVAPCINQAIGGATTFLGRDVDMPNVHYGKLPEDDLMDLWESSMCRFYRERFQERVEKHEAVMVESLVGGGGGGGTQTFDRAREAMPDPPKGCNVCHYLYDI
jgi:short-subunit dehydrogenase/MoaA/NifB/PqqE/SkfB family radical SAM enzyme